MIPQTPEQMIATSFGRPVTNGTFYKFVHFSVIPLWPVEFDRVERMLLGQCTLTVNYLK